MLCESVMFVFFNVLENKAANQRHGRAGLGWAGPVHKGYM